MDSMNLKDFNSRHRHIDSNNDISSSAYHEEINTLRIDKLSNRITIFSIIIPCMIGAILIFAYLDMKERVVDSDLSKKSQYEDISKQLEEKLNALDVRIAKNRFDVENRLPELDKKDSTLEGQIAKLSAEKADNKNIQEHFSKIKKRLDKSDNQAETMNLAMKKNHRQNIAAIKKNKSQINKANAVVNKEIKLFKEKIEARLNELYGFKQKIGQLGEEINQFDEKYQKLEQDNREQAEREAVVMNKISELETFLEIETDKLYKQLKELNQRVTANISRLENKDINDPAAALESDKPEPEITVESSAPVKIEEESLTQ